jgi:hypothetical protein
MKVNPAMINIYFYIIQEKRQEKYILFHKLLTLHHEMKTRLCSYNEDGKAPN